MDSFRIAIWLYKTLLFPMRLGQQSTCEARHRKNAVKAMEKNGGFRFLKRNFPKLSEAKIKERVYQKPQIRQLMLDCDFKKSFTDLQKETWLLVKAVINNFLGNTKSRNYKDLANTMLQNFQVI